jgi:iron complex outermembrane receptor protein
MVRLAKQFWAGSEVGKKRPFCLAGKGLGRGDLQDRARSVSMNLLKQGCSTKVGLRNTLEPDPDNTGVGSFRSEAAFLIPSCEFSCFTVLKQGEHMPGSAVAVTAHSLQAFQSRIRVSVRGCRRLAKGFVLAAGVAAPVCATAQNTAQPSATSTQISDTQNPPAPQLPRVTTTVEVHGEAKDDYLAAGATAGSLDGTLLKETPLSVTAVTRSVLSDQLTRVLSDVVKNDASVGEDYAPVGYYGDFQIRGFPIDLATGLQINGMTIAGEQDVPLENKESVEFVKGIAGVESGVASAGGLIDYVTKEPSPSQRPAIDLATDHRGTAYGALDAGHVFKTRFEPGIRVNLAGEDMHTYVQHADGWRGMGAADGSLHFDPKTNLYTDFEYQHRVQRSVSGYQLLGGTTVPSPVYPSTMLGYQPWGKPNTFDVFNAGSRLQHSFNATWSGQLNGSYSHSLIDDNVIWPYGAALDANGNSVCPVAYFFCPDGSYEIYDYRSPGELRVDAVGEALVQGNFVTGRISHDVVGGGSIFHRTVDLASPIVYTPVGVENVYQPNISYAQEIPYQRAGPATLADFDRQASGIVQERMHLPGGVALLAGGRYVRVTDFTYPSAARSLWLPQYAATYAPRHDLTLYGNYGVLLSLGPQAPWWADNANQFLQPYFTRQSEIGVKYERQVLLTAAFFHMRQPFFYPRTIQGPDSFCTINLSTGDPVQPNDQCFESDGRETHNGVELSAQGRAASWLQLTASAAAISAISSGSSTPSYNDQQVINVPRFHAALFADLIVPHVNGLHLMPGWGYTGRKEATRDDEVSVGGYNLFNLGARYTPGGEQGRMTFRIYADNILDKRYWKDTGASYGDTFLHLGAPTTIRLSVHYSF